MIIKQVQCAMFCALFLLFLRRFGERSEDRESKRKGARTGKVRGKGPRQAPIYRGEKDAEEGGETFRSKTSYEFWKHSVRIRE